ncbi:acyl-CoA N-acyltransferase [Sistotremastrum niveocremeum HHB9708]|uniref:Acyl-CoA N-acyltransferase n=1 Tax=Sistotremastrum niveocremeum HHB9708 TaxID=1314777 RepID=A0A164N5D5_9AGAM|nr:acyl-CoA N-acyltransferase [Sistotremastrum niveocremeum HHB9708]
MTTYIREAREEDKPSISRICLLTSNFGTSAEHLHTIGELPGLMWALPYVSLPTTFGYVLVAAGKDGAEEVVGYIVATSDSKKYREATEETWFPPLREKYPLELASSPELTDLDKFYVNIIHKPFDTPENVLEFSPAHIHMNILPPLQRQGWGRKLMKKVVEHLQEVDPKMEGLWIGVDPRNEEGKKFYKKLGATHFPTEHGEHYILRFSAFK